MTETQHTHTKAEIKKAWTLVNDYVARHASDAPNADREDAAAVAIENWRAGKGSELECARRAVSAHFRKNTRQRRIRRERAEDVRNASHGGRSNDEDERVRRFKKTEQDELRAAVMKHCRELYLASWGRPWKPEKAGRIRALLKAGDDVHVKVENEAGERLEELAAALQRSILWSQRTLSSGRDAYGPKVGGPLTAKLCAALESERLEQ